MAPSTYQSRRGAQALIVHTLEQPIIAVRPEIMPTMFSEEKNMLERFQRLYPPHFDGDTSQDTQDYLDRFHHILHYLSLVESNRVDFTIF